MNNNNQFSRDPNSGYSGNPEIRGPHNLSDAHKLQDSVGGIPTPHSEGMVKSNQDNRYDLDQQNTSNVYGTSYLGQGKSDNSHGFNQNQSSSQGNYGMDGGIMRGGGMGPQSHPVQQNMMGYANMTQNQPPIGQRNFPSYGQPQYGFPHMAGEMPSDLGGMMPGSMQHSYIQSNKSQLPSMQAVGMSSATGGFNEEKTYVIGSTSQLAAKPYEGHSDLPLAHDILRDFEEKAAKCKQYKQTEVFAAILLKNEDDTLMVIDYL